MTRTRPGRGRGRGRPPLFDDHAKRTYLKLVAEGMLLDQAAAAVGVARRTVNWHDTHDRAFHEARQRAKEAGRQVRWEGKPHDEYRYIHGGCRCTKCRTAASTARAGRRAVAAEEPQEKTADTRPDDTTIITLTGRNTRPDLPLSPLAAVS